ncbi:OmpA/MotB domain protein [Paludibacter propionicigenes WB4]|uniref:OmpA/MotB domain protein n=1 Tax=Paludibacter propionicigenes (strain DSM 17365 / JCM 13257 / WB4) TaxID=694427 RepID=E4T2R9_PALPW|nr:OmpA family protein [Paludibacter propionicigenes]ADQ79013.1 OmpA/MotB domain protein [Paludibacter propionicigenes WB4]
MRTKLSFSLFLLLVVVLLSGCSLKARIKKADKAFGEGQFFSAAEKYKRVYGYIPSNQKQLKARIAFQQAESYRLINYTRAEQSYVNAIRYNYPDSIVYLHFAQVLQRNGKYGEALKNYTIYLKKDSSSLLAKNGVISCKQVDKWKNQPNPYIVRKADLFNVRNAENFSPAFLGTESDALMFTSSRQFSKTVKLNNSSITGLPNNNIFTSKRNALGKLEKPVIIGDEINTVEGDEGACSFTTDGKVMYFTRSVQTEDSELGTQIYSSNRVGLTWSTPQRLKIFNDSTISVAHPAIAPDGQTLYFVSDSKKGLGGKDIWKGTISNGECKYIENLGPEINTPGDEMFPTVRADGSLYFSSNGRVGLGGLDIYKATSRKEGGWLVENMGSPINSSADDFGMTFERNAERGYFSSNRNEIKGLDAIWSFELPALVYYVEGKVSDDKGNGVPDATVRLVSNNGMNARIQTKKDGTYRIKIDKDLNCVVFVSARGYLNQNTSLSTQGLVESKTFNVDFKLSAISKPIQIENIFYESGKWELTPASENGLQVLVKLLNDNPNITIEISANTDLVGSNADNKALSTKRAKSVVDYLISKKIAPDRLTSVGYGEEKPVVVDAAMAKKYPFLKENDVLDEAYVLKLTPAQQEVANQINRRTEFRVLKTTYKLY